MDPTDHLKISATASEDKHETARNSPASDELSKEIVSPGAANPAADLDTGKENRFICATCGYQGNNRKALYR